MDFKKLRRRCEDRLKALDLPQPFTVDAFRSSLEAQRHRLILLRPVTSTVGPWGLWVALPSTDLIFYEEATTSLHQQHIILHELCHLICDHRTPIVAPAEVRQLLFPDLNIETVERILRRSGYLAEEEQEAEMLASLILERTPFTVSTNESFVDRQHADLLGRLASSLEANREEPG